jgi:WD40-like Beta Propeller Repeat
MRRPALATLALLLITTPAWSADPVVVGDGVISTPADEFGGQLDRDDATLFFNRSIPRSQIYTLFESRRVNGRWAAPEVVPWSGTWRDFDATLSPDGQRLYFISDRPREGSASRGDYDVWRLERTSTGWSAPQNVGPPINGDWGTHFASEAADGTLYFTSDRPGGTALVDVWRARREGEGYAAPENLGATINAPGQFNLEAVIAPDQSFLILSAAGREDSQGDSDLYVCYAHDGRWLVPQSLGPGVNTSAREYSPRLSPDGRRLIFASERGVPTESRMKPWTYVELEQKIRGVQNGLGNLYEVDLASVLPAPPAPHE